MEELKGYKEEILNKSEDRKEMMIVILFVFIIYGLAFFTIYSLKSKSRNFVYQEKIQKLIDDKYSYKEVADSSGNITSYIFLIENDEEKYQKLEFASERTTVTNTCDKENAYVKYFENDAGSIAYAKICLPSEN